MRQLKKFIVARFDGSTITYHPSISGILLGNNESDNPYFFFIYISFLSFKTRVFFSEEKLASYSYALVSLIFVHYLVSHLAYLFLYFFLSNSKLFDSFLGKGWWYVSSVTMVISLECSYPYLSSYVFWWDEFFRNGGNITFTFCINQFLLLNIFFIFLQTSTDQVDFSLFWALNLLCHRYIFSDVVNAGYP